MTVQTIDCHYTDQALVAAAYLIREGDELAIVETNTSLAVPRILEAIEATGLSTDAVKYVIITHVHLDHAGGAGTLMAACANATLLAHPRAAPHAIDPTKLIRSAQQVYGVERFATLYGEITPVPPERVQVMAHDETLPWGSRVLTFLHTRGHANHHFAIHDSRENGVFTGDAFGIGYPAAQTGGAWLFPSTSPTDFDAEAAIASVHTIVNTGAQTAWLTHFGAITGLQAYGEQLIAQLQRYGELLERADLCNLEGQALTDFCAGPIDQWFAEDLDKRGFASDGDIAVLTRLDRELNAQGVAFAVQKRRFKRSKR